MNKLKSIAMMAPDLLEKYKLFEAKMLEAKIPFVLTSVARTVKEQVALYSQGRDPISTVNKLRKIAGMPSIKPIENHKVTWTLQSKHLIDLDDGIEDNNWSRAFDIAIVGPNQQPTWNLKVDVNRDNMADYIQAGPIGESVGLRWGGRFKNSRGESVPDFPHYEI
jgi:peptidoglycan L-alanyl-D-glutamate endopeptidase CwlK